jgi:hypothetical protein
MAQISIIFPRFRFSQAKLATVLGTVPSTGSLRNRWTSSTLLNESSMYSVTRIAPIPHDENDLERLRLDGRERLLGPLYDGYSKPEIRVLDRLGDLRARLRFEKCLMYGSVGFHFARQPVELPLEIWASPRVRLVLVDVSLEPVHPRTVKGEELELIEVFGDERSDLR